MTQLISGLLIFYACYYTACFAYDYYMQNRVVQAYEDEEEVDITSMAQGLKTMTVEGDDEDSTTGTGTNGEAVDCSGGCSYEEMMQEIESAIVHINDNPFTKSGIALYYRQAS